MKRHRSGSTAAWQGRRRVREENARCTYEFDPLRRYVVIAPGVCGGRPTFKGTRVAVQTVLDALRSGQSVADILGGYAVVSRAGVHAALHLAAQARTDHYALTTA